MPLFGCEEFFDAFSSYRVLWLRGRQGGGKTSHAFRLAYELLERGLVKYVTSNIPNVWNTHAKEWELTKDYTLDVCVILDEGGKLISGVKDANSYLFGLRKLNAYIIIPSFLKPSSRVCFLDTQRVSNLQKWTGLPAWFYRWSLFDNEQRYKGSYLWYGVKEIYGIYSSKSAPMGDGGVRKKLAESISKLAALDSEYWDEGEEEKPSHPYPFDYDGRQSYDTGAIEEIIENAVSSMEETGGNIERQVSEAQYIAAALSRSRRR